LFKKAEERIPAFTIADDGQDKLKANPWELLGKDLKESCMLANQDPVEEQI